MSLVRGKSGEDLACEYLEAQGVKLLTRNFRCRMGEIDLIVRDGKYLVFVEVRSRKNSRYGSPAETVNKRKQARLIRAANFYLQTQQRDWPCRFDVIAITAAEHGEQHTTNATVAAAATVSSGGSRIDWIKDAFQVF